MKSAKKRPVTIRLQYENLEEVDLIKEAAARRGIGFGLFQRMICLGAAKHVLAAPAEPVLGQYSKSALAELQAQL
jgi:hypothetical protein